MQKIIYFIIIIASRLTKKQSKLFSNQFLRDKIYWQMHINK